MKTLFGIAALSAVFVPASSASACPPPPPGYVHPTELQQLERYVSGASDIVYGIITHSEGERARFSVIHVYKGTLLQGETVETTIGRDFPVPYYCFMAGPHPLHKPVGTYGVATFRDGRSEVSFIPPEHVHTMIEKGWIQSARAR